MDEMNSTPTTGRSIERLLFWSPRILGILAILFMMLFSLDCFEDGISLKEQLICFLMHNIPSWVIIGILAVAWKWEKIGGVLFLAAALAGMIFFNAFSGNWGAILVMSPFAITGALFILHQDKYHKAAN